MDIDAVNNITRRLAEMDLSFNMRVEPRGRTEAPAADVYLTVNAFCDAHDVGRLLELAEHYELKAALIEDGVSLTG